MADIVRVGRIGPRTPVRLADGRVRWYSVAGFAPCWSARTSVESGAALAAADSATAERDVIALGCETVDGDRRQRWRAPRGASPWRGACARSRAARAATWSAISAVTLSANAARSHSVSRVLIATADAHAGERVRLRDPASGDTVMASLRAGGRRAIWSHRSRKWHPY